MVALLYPTSPSHPPPQFLLDGIDAQTYPFLRRFAGIVLALHVSISFAINSTALSSAIAASNISSSNGTSRSSSTAVFATSSSAQSSSISTSRIPSTFDDDIPDLFEDAVLLTDQADKKKELKRRPLLSSYISPKFGWLLITTTITICVWFIANAVPFFADLNGLIGAITSIPLGLVLPLLYSLEALKGNKGRGECRIVVSISSWIIICIALLLTIFGTMSSCNKIYLDWLAKMKI